MTDLTNWKEWLGGGGVGVKDCLNASGTMAWNSPCSQPPLGKG